MTNGERWRRRLAHSPVCGRCAQEEEGVMHTVRDCDQARKIWVSVIPSNLQSDFFSMQVMDCITWVIKKGQRMNGVGRWGERILIVAWLQWKRRNEKVMRDGRMTNQQKFWHVTWALEDDGRAFVL